MLITCPECATRYEVDDSAFSAGGRAVRCNHCGCEWYQIGPARAAAAPAPVVQDAQPQEPYLTDDEERGRAAQPGSAQATPPLSTPNLSMPNLSSSSLSSSSVGTPGEGEPDAYRKAPGDWRGGGWAEEAPDAATSDAEATPRSAVGGRRAPRSKRRALGSRVDGGPAAIGSKLDAGLHLPAIVESEVEAGDLRRAARASAPARRSSRIGAVIGFLVLAGAAAVGAQLLGSEGAETTSEDDATLASTQSAPDPRSVAGQGDEASPIAGVTGIAASADAGVSPGALQPGVVFIERKFDLQDLPEGPALVVWGVVANNGPTDAPQPIIDVISRDESGEKLNEFRATTEVEVLEAGRSARFSARMMYPESPVHHVDFYIVQQ